MLDFLRQCKIVLDLQHPKQQGLSFIVFEALTYGKKLITLNQDIVTYDFYRPENIHVVEDINAIKFQTLFLKLKP